MLKTVIGLFDARDQAEKAASDLRGSGFKDEISILAADRDKTVHKTTGTGAGDLTSGVTTGGVLGGLAGLGLGAGALALPGIGPIIAAGPLAGIVSGALTGGVAGGLVDWGIPAERGKFYEEKVKEGKILASVRTDEGRISNAADILRRNGARDVEIH